MTTQIIGADSSSCDDKRAPAHLYAAGDFINNIDPSGLGWIMGSVRFVKSKGSMLLGRASGAIVVGCYAKKAWDDTDDSWSDEFSDLGHCANPIDDLTS
ncbi:hypothetical protein ACFVGN_12550 [Streptomyces sp. NPDC057757]|uniref:hypothetical protein n=1 Tax=Streptomyces sp. NPDC057757 TaxID=3346241 RepID=UPI0036C9368E